MDYVSRPPHLAGAIGPYAVYVASSSMEPRYYAGEIVYIHPGRTVTPGAFVLVQVKPGSEGEAPRAFIKRLVRRTATKMTFEQFNPPKELVTSRRATSSRCTGSLETPRAAAPKPFPLTPQRRAPKFMVRALMAQEELLLTIGL